jgi:uncharacterized delta-60 repeat protein
MTAGELDPSFANAGVLDLSEWFPSASNSGSSDDIPYADVRISADGNMDLIVRNGANELRWDRFDKNGVRDPNFGTSAERNPDSPPLETIVLLQRNGGFSRYFSDGTIDHTFGDNGLLSFYGNYEVQPDGLSAIGMSQRLDLLLGNVVGHTIIQTFFDADGSPIPGADQIEFTLRDPGPDQIAGNVRDHVFDSEGRLLVLTTVYVRNEGNSRVMLVRFNPDGTQDTSFGIDGFLITKLWGAPAEPPQFALQPNGDILVFGTGDNLPDLEYHLARFHSDGSVDRDFGDDGVIRTGFYPNRGSLDPSIKADSQGNILLVGSEGMIIEGWPETRFVKRFFSDGTLDEVFTNAAREAVDYQHWPCQFFDPEMELIDDDDIVLLIRDVPQIGPAISCHRESIMLKISGGQDVQRDVQRSDLQAAVRVTVTDLEGKPVTEATAGQQLKLNVFVSDERQDAAGVFAAYVDLTMTGVQVTTSEPVEYGEHFQNGRSGNVHGEIIDEVGAFGGLELPNSSELLLFSVVVRVDTPGQMAIRTEAADELPGHRMLLYGQPDDEQARVNYGSVTIPVIAPTWHNAVDPADTNHDGAVGPMDVLLLINLINRGGIGPIQDLSVKFPGLIPGNHSLSDAPYVDVNNDLYLAPNDVLMVINAIHAASLPQTSSRYFREYDDLHDVVFIDNCCYPHEIE